MAVTYKNKGDIEVDGIVIHNDATQNNESATLGQVGTAQTAANNYTDNEVSTTALDNSVQVGYSTYLTTIYREQVEADAGEVLDPFGIINTLARL